MPELLLEEEIADENKENIKRVLKHLKPRDVLAFEGKKGRLEYFFVESIGPTRTFATGAYVYSSRKVETRRISFTRIAELEPLVTGPIDFREIYNNNAY